MSAVALFLVLSAAVTPAAGEGDAQRGKLIYTTGKSAAGSEVTFRLGETGSKLSAGIMPCLNCHGPDGKGRLEGGVEPSDLTWASLSRPDGNVSAAGRRHGPYDEVRVAMAVRTGVDPSGNRLQNVMPQFQMSDADMRDLIAYLKVLGNEKDPGVSPDRLGVGVLLPGGRPGALVKQTLEAWFADTNRRGGIYGRRLEAHFVTAGAELTQRAESLRELMSDDQVFVLLAPFVYELERQTAALAAHHGVPVLGPLTPHPWIEFPPNRWVFHLNGGLQAQARALLNFAVEQGWPEGGSAWVLHAGDPLVRPGVEAVEDLNAARNLPLIRAVDTSRIVDVSELVENLQKEGVELIYLFGLGEENHHRVFFETAQRLDWSPRLLIPGDAAAGGAGALPKSFAGRVFTAYNQVPEDLSQAGFLRYQRLRKGTALPQQPSAMMLSVLGGAALMEKGLESAGRDCTRAGLIEALESLYQWPTGFTPPVTYSRNLRLGANGAYVVELNLQKGIAKPHAVWVQAEPK